MLVLTSWDDGHPCDLRVAELLSKYGLAGTFFVPIENREGRPVVGKNEIRELDSSFEIGGHTLTHRYLQGLDADIRNEEVVEGKRRLEEIIGHGVSGFCYPGGRFDGTVLRTVRDAGFVYSRTTENLRFDVGSDLWRVPTTLQFFPHTARTLARNVFRYPASSKIRLVLERLGTDDFNQFAEKVAELCARSSGVFHLWGHSWEIEQERLWNHLEILVRHLAGLATQSLTLADALRCPQNASAPLQRRVNR